MICAGMVAMDEELRGHTVQLLADFFAAALQGVAFGTDGRLDFVAMFNPLQLTGQRLALWGCAWLPGLTDEVGGTVFAVRLGDQGLQRRGVSR